MTTLITATKRDGSTRRCTAKCYNAKGKSCTCICGGRYHGIGFNPDKEPSSLGFLENLGRRHPDFTFSFPAFRLELLDRED